MNYQKSVTNFVCSLDNKFESDVFDLWTTEEIPQKV